MTHSAMLRAVCLLAAPLLVTACIEGSPDKGVEDDPLDGKADGFYTPTDHGTLRFAAPNQAAFTDGEGFHAWTFSLSASGTVDLATELDAPNLDTVIYLYKKGSSGWGQAIQRNDDASEATTASRLNVALAEGEYRLVAKAYKRTQRGAFAVTAACSGGGCPSGGECPAPAALPDDTGYGGGCGRSLAAIYEYGQVDVASETETTVAGRCSLPPLERQAVDYYAAYWRDLTGELEDETALTVGLRVLGGTGENGGTLVDVTDGGDESAITFVFDHGGRLVALYQHNQSPDVRFYCRGNGTVIELPNVEDCVGALVGAVPHGDGTEEEVELTSATGNLPAGLGAEVGASMRRYAESRGLSTTTRVTASGARWEDQGDPVARLTVTAVGKAATGYLATSRLILLEQPSDGVPQLVCVAP
jgi:hypothetical protein